MGTFGVVLALDWVLRNVVKRLMIKAIHRTKLGERDYQAYSGRRNVCSLAEAGGKWAELKLTRMNERRKLTTRRLLQSQIDGQTYTRSSNDSGTERGS
jgi:hypothetical protein